MFKFFKSNPSASNPQTGEPAAVLSTAAAGSVLEAAAKAPSGHNTQPWKFNLAGNNLRIFPDFSRSLPVVDPVNRELWISLGCAVENAVIAAAEAGFASDVSYPSSGDTPITLTFHRQISLSACPLSRALDTRETNRGDYSGKPASPQALAALSAVTTGPGTAFMILTDPTHIERLLFWIRQGNAAQLGNPLFVSELIRWTRFDRAEAEASLDGLYAAFAASGDVSRELGTKLIANHTPVRQNNVDEHKIRSSSGCILIATTTDSIPAWVEAGRLYERISLTLALEGLTSAFINQPVEVPELRKGLDENFRLAPFTSQLLLRFGHASPATRSYRRPLKDLLI